MEHISTLLPRVLRKRGLKDEAEASLVVHTAKRWFEERGGLIPDVRKFASGTLFIEVRSSAEAQECQAASEELLTFLRERFPNMRMEKVRIMRGASGGLLPG